MGDFFNAFNRVLQGNSGKVLKIGKRKTFKTAIEENQNLPIYFIKTTKREVSKVPIFCYKMISDSTDIVQIFDS